MLGYAHPNQLLDQLSSSEISEWIAYNRIEPIDSNTIGWATLCSVVSNIAISIYGKEGRKYTTPADFVPGNEVNVVQKEQTVEEQKKILLTIANIQNSKRK